MSGIVSEPLATHVLLILGIIGLPFYGEVPMPAKHLTWRKIKDILRLKRACGHSNQQVAASCGVARSTAAETLYRARAAWLSWPFPEELDNQQLETRLYPVVPSPTSPPRAMPEWATVHPGIVAEGRDHGAALVGVQDPASRRLSVQSARVTAATARDIGGSGRRLDTVDGRPLSFHHSGRDRPTSRPLEIG